MASRASFKMMRSKKSSKREDVRPSLPSPQMPSSWWSLLSEKQEKAAQFVVNTLGAALLGEAGSGKTIITLAALEVIKPKRLLIVTPLTSIEVTWAERLRQSGYAVFLELMKDDGVCVVGYEFFRNHIKQIQKLHWDMIIFDESQGLKARNSKQSRASRRLRLKVKRKLILSGTPIDDSPIDFWAQFRLIEPSVLGDRWGDFDEKFLKPSGFMGYQREFRKEMLPEFMRLIAPYCFRLDLDKPPPVFFEVPVTMFGRQRRIYDQMNNHGIVKIDEHKIKAGLTLTKNLRCLQITSGFLGLEDGSIIEVGRAKQRKLAWLIKRLDKPVVFCRYTKEVEDVKAVLGEEFHRVKSLTGKIKDKKNDPARTQLLKDFQAGKVDALVCQTRTGGVSIEFTASRELVFYSMGYSYIDFQQIIARFRRFTTVGDVRVYLIVARNTVDEEPLERILEKGDVVNPIMDYLKEHSMSDTETAPVKKAAKKTAKKAAPKKVAKKETKSFKYGVDYLAKKTNLAEATIRIKLRDAKVKKEGKSYGWNSQADADKVAASLTK
jgi:SNF2 family DNA or RNA helicase